MNELSVCSGNLVDIPCMLTERQAADVLGVSVAMMRKMRWQQRGPVYRRVAGRSIRYPSDRLQEWINRQPSFGGGEQ